ncbi:MAG: ABC transporter permease [Chitinophagales bacterium]|jgi:ABC-2 type transport system permease protein|nr:ABC transporter permease [Sphingobacteriales bacterium]
MKKILLIAFRDFSIRIRNKTFLISTLLLPIGIILFYGTIFFFTSTDTDTHRIGVIDEKSYVLPHLTNEDNFEFKAMDKLIPANAKLEDKDKFDAILIVPNQLDSLLVGKFQIMTYTKVGLLTKNKLESILQNLIETKRFEGKSIDMKTIEEVKKQIQPFYKSVTGGEENEIKEGIAYALSFGLGIMMYVILTIYGAQVMRGVMEEKTNRIVEIIISSVKPFELLLGKIIGIGMVSLLQLSVWGFFIIIINLFLAFILGANQLNSMPENFQGGIFTIFNNPNFKIIFHNLQSNNFVSIFLLFLFYFISGFFLYSSLFAAVGASVGDDPQDVQSLMMPIMMPIFLSFIFLSKSINNPNCTEAVVASMVPFTAPVVMISRVVFGIPEGVPLWQLMLSMVIMICTTIFFIFLASRIYKTGILLYGKKVGWKEMIQWIFIK